MPIWRMLSDCVWNQAKGLEIVKTQEKGASLILFLKFHAWLHRGGDMLSNGMLGAHAWVPGEDVKALDCFTRVACHICSLVRCLML